MNEEIYNKVKELLVKEKFLEDRAWIEVDEDDWLSLPPTSSNDFRIQIIGNFIWWEFLLDISKIPDVYIRSIQTYPYKNSTIIIINCIVIKEK